MSDELVYLDGDGVGILIDARPTGGLPRVLHWGASLGAPDAAQRRAAADAVSRQSPPGTLDAVWEPSILPVEGDGWSGRPGLQLRRRGSLLNSRWTVDDTHATASTFAVRAHDDAAGVSLEWTARIETGGVVWVQCRLQVDATAEPVEIDWLETTLPTSSTTTHATSLDGRWTREKRPSTTALPAGAVTRQSRRGRPGHDAPMILALSEGEPRWRQGRVWAAHLAWSADTTYRSDRVTDSTTLLGTGELLRPGEMVLAPGDAYETPAAAFVFSEMGWDGVSERMHAWMRGRAVHPRSARPFTLNTWEAVYFDHDPARVERLAVRAAEVGVERFVLDDGWFRGRRDDSTSLGDWFVDIAVWPQGLRPLVDRVHGLGMQFGLWFEPEMVSLDSDLARAHPDWLLHDRRHLEHDASLSWRNQYVLDLAHPGAYAYVLERMSTLVGELAIDYIKWDHNRDLVETVHDGRPGTHAQTQALYALIGELKRQHPGLEIESCSSGGARTDLGIMRVCDRVWASDSNDPVERQDIQRWTGLLLPPELVGSHVGPTRSHSSGRVTSLGMRMATSLMGSAGLEWDILECDDDETAALARFAALYKELRPLLHSSRVMHPELRDAAWRVTAYLAADSSEAVVIVATVASIEDARAERLRIPDLDPKASYRVRVRREIGDPEAGWVLPPWLTSGETILPGAVLSHVGLQLPTLWPMNALILHLTAL
jgi:alpha-galactosidase